MKVAFISGPLRASTQQGIEDNIHRAEAAALRAWLDGYAVICPHANTKFADGSSSDAMWLEGHLAILRRCDVIVMLPDWEDSLGAIAEHDAAIAAGLEVIYEVRPSRVEAPNV